MLSFNFRNVCDAYYELIWNMKINGVERDSRNGRVLTITEPVGVTLTHPEERVIFDEVRDANPFFHLLESVWMLAGEQHVGWLLEFNKKMADYAESDGILRGAYGFRWRYHFNYDQLLWAVGELKRNPDSRRVVISMWDSGYDTVGAPKEVRDLPCNTHIYLRIEYGKLAFTVCNRSNDMIWGMLGANAVHMTVLQEVLAQCISTEERPIGVGPYTVMTNNLHIYKNMPKFEQIMDTIGPVNPYWFHLKPLPIHIDNGLIDFLGQCQAFVNGHMDYVKNFWLQTVAMPVMDAWFKRTEESVNKIAAEDWRQACKEWISRRVTSSSSTSTAPSPAIIIDDITSMDPVIPITTGMGTLEPVVATPLSSPSFSLLDSSNSTESEFTSSQDEVIQLG